MEEPLTREQLDIIHNRFKAIIRKIIKDGCKFEEILYLTRRIIRSDYRRMDPSIEDIVKCTYNWYTDFEKEKISIVIDPAVTPKKTYYEIIDNIYAANHLKTQIKDTRTLTKDQRLFSLLDVNYLHTYHNLTQIQIVEELRVLYPSHLIEDEFRHSKDINRYIKLAQTIKTTSDQITSNQYLI